MHAKQLFKAVVGSAWQASPPGRKRLQGAGVVLMLHRVLADDQAANAPHRGPLCVGQQSFEKLLVWLREHFDCVALEQLLEQPAGKRPRVALTFDDGWRDNAEYAYPLLERYGVPASIFLSTDFIGSRQGFWWESIGETLWQHAAGPASGSLREQLHSLGVVLPDVLLHPGTDDARSRELGGVLQRLKVLPADTLQALADACPDTGAPHSLDWSQVRQLERSGLVRFGPHGASHGILTQFNATQLAADLRRSHDTLSSQCRAPLHIYCYPNGDHNGEVRTAVASLGYRFALATQAGLIEPGQDLLALPRIDVSQATARAPALLAWRLFKGARA